MMANQDTALQNPTKYRFVVGVGYIRVGEPSMPVLINRLPEDAEPDPPAAAGSCHFLKRGDEGEPVEMRWSASQRCWLTPQGRGKRVAFTPAYLAALGWSYVGPR